MAASLMVWLGAAVVSQDVSWVELPAANNNNYPNSWNKDLGCLAAH